MRPLFILFLFLGPILYAQTSLFSLDQIESKSFNDYISSKQIIVIGELHGTTEIPQFVLQLAKIMQAGDKPLTVGLEISSTLQANVNEFLQSGDFDKLIKAEYFKTQDGRTSIAMGELIKGLRRLSKIKIICFDVDDNTTLPFSNRDSVMAETINNNKPLMEQMLILTGNLHATLQKGYWRAGFQSAIFRLKAMNNLNNKIISINTYFKEGTIWNCMSDGCKERNTTSMPDDLAKKYGMINFLVFHDDLDNDGYNGFIFLDHVVASRPLVE